MSASRHGSSNLGCENLCSCAGIVSEVLLYNRLEIIFIMIYGKTIGNSVHLWL